MVEEDGSTQNDGMIQCEITGQWVPEEAIVTIQGHRVCAEGKAELLERLNSGQRMPGELERSTVMQRFGAMLVDGLLLGVIYFVLGLVIVGVSIFTAAAAPAGGTVKVGFAAFMVLFLIINAVYYTLMHGYRGQTLGKMAAKIKVVNSDASAINMKTAFMRMIYYQGPGMVNGLFTAFVAFMAAAPVAEAVSGILGVVVVIYWITNVVMALIDSDRQRTIHDRLARTRVIQCEAEATS